MEIDVPRIRKYLQDAEDAKNNLNLLTYKYSQSDIIEFLVSQIKKLNEENPDLPDIWAVKFLLDNGERWFDDDSSYIEGREYVSVDYYLIKEHKSSSLEEDVTNEEKWQYTACFLIKDLDIIKIISKNEFDYGYLYVCVDGSWLFEESSPY